MRFVHGTCLFVPEDSSLNDVSLCAAHALSAEAARDLGKAWGAVLGSLAVYALIEIPTCPLKSVTERHCEVSILPMHYKHPPYHIPTLEESKYRNFDSGVLIQPRGRKQCTRAFPDPDIVKNQRKKGLHAAEQALRTYRDWKDGSREQKLT